MRLIRKTQTLFFAFGCKILIKHVSCFLVEILQKLNKSSVIVRARINDAVVILVVGGLEFLFGIAVKSKLQNLHARISYVAHQTINAFIKDAKVLGNDLPIFFTLKKRLLRSVAPATDLCIHASRGNRIEAVKATEVVNAYNVVHSKGLLQSRRPP